MTGDEGQKAAGIVVILLLWRIARVIDGSFVYFRRRRLRCRHRLVVVFSAVVVVVVVIVVAFCRRRCVNFRRRLRRCCGRCSFLLSLLLTVKGKDMLT